MRLGWDEIKRRAKAFSEEWQHAHYEKGETQTFYNEFFAIFGIVRKQVFAPSIPALPRATQLAMPRMGELHELCEIGKSSNVDISMV